MILEGARCSFCNLVIADAPPHCPARMLIPGERFPHEPSTPGSRMTRDTVSRLKTRSIFGGRKRR
jgi:hypothetical protein